ENGFDVLYDDRNIGAGAKFKDADLIGIPLRVNVGKEYLKSGLFELRERETGNVSRDDTNTLLAKIHDFYI
ncbi:MAG: His/Gly/Thr/Pro-type tRNA ligase C-terminal domain-containing protein, partial [Nanoarchaeota archaeon]